MFAVHRLIWKLLYNSEPDEIDHINGDRADNRAANLRSVCKTENCRNQRLRSDNTSGHVGVSWDKRKSRWLAKIVVDGKERHIGSFHRREDAEKARQRTQSQLGFHPNHGRRI
jgi:topoisomerase IA-like protein